MRSPANISLDETGDFSTETITNEHHKNSSGVRVQLGWGGESFKNNHESFQM